MFGLACQTKAKHDGFTIKGTVKGIDNVYVKLCATGDRENVHVIDSTLIENGEFTFKGKVEHVDLVNLEIDSRLTGLLMLENSEIDVKIDISNLGDRAWNYTPLVKGSASHDLYTQLNEKASAIFKKEKYKPLEELRPLFAAAKKSKKKEDMDKAMALQKELRPLAEEQSNEYLKVKFDFVDQNPSSPTAIHVMGYQYSEGRMNKEDLKKYYDFFQGDAKKTGFYRGYMTKVYKNVFENLGEGNIAPDFTLSSVNGEEVTLSKVDGKYLLVDFWASWCVPCRASFPHLKKLRKKYLKEGFEIVGVGTADTEDRWRKAIKKDQTPWINLFDVSEKRGAYGPVAQKYGVPHLPTVFLIDSEGKILLRNPSKEQLDAKLKELFGF